MMVAVMRDCVHIKYLHQGLQQAQRGTKCLDSVEIQTMESGALPLSLGSLVLLCAEQCMEAQGAEVGNGAKPVLLPVKTSMCSIRTRHNTPQAPITLLKST